MKLQMYISCWGSACKKYRSTYINFSTGLLKSCAFTDLLWSRTGNLVFENGQFFSKAQRAG